MTIERELELHSCPMFLLKWLEQEQRYLDKLYYNDERDRQLHKIAKINARYKASLRGELRLDKLYKNLNER